MASSTITMTLDANTINWLENNFLQTGDLSCFEKGTLVFHEGSDEVGDEKFVFRTPNQQSHYECDPYVKKLNLAEEMTFNSQGHVFGESQWTYKVHKPSTVTVKKSCEEDEVASDIANKRQLGLEKAADFQSVVFYSGSFEIIAEALFDFTNNCYNPIEVSTNELAFHDL